MTVERQKIFILKLQDGGRMCSKSLQTQLRQSIATGNGLPSRLIGRHNCH